MKAKQNHILNYFSILIFLIFGLYYNVYSAKTDSLLTITPKKGDGISILLKRYNIPTSKELIETFKTMNTNNLDKNGNIVLDKFYVLPIKVLPFNGKNIRTSIKNNDREIAEKIQEYNLKMKSKGLKDDFKKDRVLWVPLDNILDETFMTESEITNAISEQKINDKLIEAKKINELNSKKDASIDITKGKNVQVNMSSDSVENELANTKNIDKYMKFI